MKKTLRAKFVLLLLISMIAGCGKRIDAAQWTEEIRLSDGRMVLIERSARAYSSGFPNSWRGAEIDSKLEYVPLKIQWSGDRRLQPISFDIINDIPYLALHIMDKRLCDRRARSDYAVILLRWRDGKWEEVRVNEYPADAAIANLSDQYWGGSSKDDYKGTIPWERKHITGGRITNNPYTMKKFFEIYNLRCAQFY